MDIKAASIVIDPKIVDRVDGLDFVTIQSYADHMENGAVFPPIQIVSNGDTLWLVDGQHRIEATKKVNLEKIEANVTQGDYRDALLMSCGTNDEHGKPRTNEDKRQKVLMLLEDEEWQGWSSRKIAEKCKVGHKFVDKLRNHTGAGASMEAERTFIHHKTGQPTTMNTSNIGKSQPESVVQTEIESVSGAGWYQSSKSDDWWTPQWVFDLLDHEFGFHLDVCASAENAKCDRFFSKEDNGLDQEWSGVCWMNPPYGRSGDQGIYQWMEKAHCSARNGATVACLVPARPDTRWWWDHALDGEIRFIKGRLKYTNSSNSAPFPQAVVILRPQLPDNGQVIWWDIKNE